MARLAFGGFEGGDTNQNSFPDQGGTASTATPSTDVARSGTYSAKFASGDSFVWNAANGASNVARFGRMWFYLTGLPTADLTVMEFVLGAGTGSPVKVKIRTTGVVEMKHTGGTVFGTAGPIAINTWFCIEFSCKSNTVSGLEEYEARLDGVSFATATDATTGLPNRWRAGHSAGTLAAGKFLYGDDFALNDSSGASDTSWPGTSGRCAYLEPVSDNAVGANWVRGDGSAIGGVGYDSINNKPPVGVADAGAAAGAQLKNVTTSTTQPAAAADFNLRTPTAAGVPSGSTITHARLAAEFGDNHATSMSNGFNFQGVSNPVIAAQSNSTPTAAAGTYPTGWSDVYSPIQVAPSVTLGTAPVVRFRRNLAGSAGQAIMVCAFGMSIEYTIPTQTLTTPLLTAAPELYEPTVTDYEDNDPGTVDDPLTGTVYINGLTVRSISEVQLYVNAPDTSHLLVTLKPPDNSPEITLFDHRGSSADIGASSASPLILRDDAATTLAAGFVSGTGQTLRPEQPLSTYTNESGGLWTITVTDTTTSTVLTLTFARIASTGPKAQKKVLKPRLLTTSPTLFAPEVAATRQTVTTPLLTVAPELFAPTVVGKINTPLLTVAPELFAPLLRNILVVPLLTVTPTLLPPTLVGKINVPLLTVTPQLFGPAVNPRDVYVEPPLLDVTPEVFAPTVGAGTVTLLPPLLTVAPELFAPTVVPGTVALVVPLLTVAPTLLAPTVRLRLVVPLLTVDPELYPPALKWRLALPLLTVAPTLFPPTVRQRIVVPLLVLHPELFEPFVPEVHQRIVVELIEVDPELLTPVLIMLGAVAVWMGGEWRPSRRELLVDGAFVSKPTVML